MDPVRLAAIASVFSALAAAPLILGGYVVVQRGSPRLVNLWLALATALLLLALLAGAAGLVLGAG